MKAEQETSTTPPAAPSEAAAASTPSTTSTTAFAAPTAPILVNPATVSFETSEALPGTPPNQHYHISDSKRNFVIVPKFLAEHHKDPALKVQSMLSFLSLT